MFGLVSLGKALGLSRQEPDLIKDDIVSIRVCLHHLGVTEKDVSYLSRKISGLDGVAVTEDFYEEIKFHSIREGSFMVMLSDECLGECLEFIRSQPSVCKVEYYDWEGVGKKTLKKLFPEVFEGLYYCGTCSSELKEEGAFCVSNGCRMAVQNLREVNEKLLAAGAMEEIKPTWMTKTDGAYKYMCDCHDIIVTMDQEPNGGDDDVECPGCGDWIALVNAAGDEGDEDEPIVKLE